MNSYDTTINDVSAPVVFGDLGRCDCGSKATTDAVYVGPGQVQVRCGACGANRVEDSED